MVVPSSGVALSYLVISSPSLTRYVPRTPGCVDNDDLKIRKTNTGILVQYSSTCNTQKNAEGGAECPSADKSKSDVG